MSTWNILVLDRLIISFIIDLRAKNSSMVKLKVIFGPIVMVIDDY